MAKLTVQRASGLLFSRSPFRILIDGNEAATINRKQTKEFHLAEGHHTLKIETGWLIKWNTQKDFDLSAGKIFQVSVNPILTWAYIYILVILIAKIFVDKIMRIMVAGFLWYGYFLIALPALLVLLYYFTWGRNNYLILKEMKELNLSLL